MEIWKWGGYTMGSNRPEFQGLLPSWAPPEHPLVLPQAFLLTLLFPQALPFLSPKELVLVLWFP